jgi:hypothetical protein
MTTNMCKIGGHLYGQYAAHCPLGCHFMYKFMDILDETVTSSFSTDHAAGPYLKLIDFYHIHGF